MPLESTLEPPPAFSATGRREVTAHSSINPHFDDPVPRYEQTFDQAYQQWNTADEASQQLDVLQPTFVEVREQLKSKNTELKELKEKSATLYANTQSKTWSMMKIILPTSKGGSSVERAGKDAAQDELKKGLAAEANMMQEVERIEANLADIEKKRNALLSVAGGADDSWIQLRYAVDSSASLMSSNAIIIGETEEQLSSCESAYHLAKKAAADLNRACVTIQHAHKYFSESMQQSDSIRGTALGRAAVGGWGAQGRMFGYRDAVTLASRAQADHGALQTLGVMQISKIYDLLYGGKIRTSGVGKSVQLMLDRQEHAFEHLTKLAVWVQERVPVCEHEESLAKTKRDCGRRALASLWIHHL